MVPENSGGTVSQSHRSIEAAIDAFRAGEPVLIHDFDDREAETDLLVPASAVRPASVARLRDDAGGLVFVALGPAVAESFELPFLHDSLDHPAASFDDVGYDRRPSFSLSVNHRDTYTGVTDADRAMTIEALGRAASEPTNTAFAEEFRAPGHVHLLRGAEGGLEERSGHTELGLALAELAGCAPAVAGAEMLDSDSGQARSTASARAFADANGIPFLSGDQLLSNWTE